MLWDDPYFRGRVGDQYSVNAAPSVFCNHSATSFVLKGRSPTSRSLLSNSAISPAVLGFRTLFNARTMCSLRRRLESGIFFMAGPTRLEELTLLGPVMSALLHGCSEPVW
jgi:hypothetical protein